MGVSLKKSNSPLRNQTSGNIPCFEPDAYSYNSISPSALGQNFDFVFTWQTNAWSQPRLMVFLDQTWVHYTCIDMHRIQDDNDDDDVDRNCCHGDNDGDNNGIKKRKVHVIHGLQTVKLERLKDVNGTTSKITLQVITNNRDWQGKS